ncbi:hypothetical protein B0H19DRAFT_1066593 [Mycena capillaripes]|nr:hypothetical protein B0H19DRAFT_1066593 [Mycena capillaripes]
MSHHLKQNNISRCLTDIVEDTATLVHEKKRKGRCNTHYKIHRRGQITRPGAEIRVAYTRVIRPRCGHGRGESARLHHLRATPVVINHKPNFTLDAWKGKEKISAVGEAIDGDAAKGPTSRSGKKYYGEYLAKPMTRGRKGSKGGVGHDNTTVPDLAVVSKLGDENIRHFRFRVDHPKRHSSTSLSTLFVKDRDMGVWVGLCSIMFKFLAFWHWPTMNPAIPVSPTQSFLSESRSEIWPHKSDVATE